MTRVHLHEIVTLLHNWHISLSDMSRIGASSLELESFDDKVYGELTSSS